MAPRHTAIETHKAVTVKVVNQDKIEQIETALHPKNPAVGKIKTVLGPEILMEQGDCRVSLLGERWEGGYFGDEYCTAVAIAVVT